MKLITVAITALVLSIGAAQAENPHVGEPETNAPQTKRAMSTQQTSRVSSEKPKHKKSTTVFPTKKAQRDDDRSRSTDHR